MTGWIILTVWAAGAVWTWLPLSRALLAALCGAGSDPDGFERGMAALLGAGAALAWPLALLVMWGARQLADDQETTR